MKSFFDSQDETRNPSREIITGRLKRFYPENAFDNDDEIFEYLAEYDSQLDEKYEKLRKDQSQLAALFSTNPKVGALISDVIEGEDPLVACVRYFGLDALECASDEARMEQLRGENGKYLSGASRYIDSEKQLKENWSNSEDVIERFKEAKEMTTEEFEEFLSRVNHLCNHLFSGDFTFDTLELFYKGLNYDSDMDYAEQMAEVKGRNDKILLSRVRSEDSFSGSSKGASKRAKADVTPVFGFKRRRSVWDM